MGTRAPAPRITGSAARQPALQQQAPSWSSSGTPPQRAGTPPQAYAARSYAAAPAMGASNLVVWNCPLCTLENTTDRTLRRAICDCCANSQDWSHVSTRPVGRPVGRPQLSTSSSAFRPAPSASWAAPAPAHDTWAAPAPSSPFVYSFAPSVNAPPPGLGADDEDEEDLLMGGAPAW